MRNVEIVRGFRDGGHEEVYAADPLVDILDGDIIDSTGSKVTLTDTHIECGIAIQPTGIGGSGKKEASGKIPVYVSNFTCRTKRFAPATYNVNDAVSVKDGLPTPVDDTNTIVWGYVTAVGTSGGTIDIRVNY